MSPVFTLCATLVYFSFINKKTATAWSGQETGIKYLSEKSIKLSLASKNVHELQKSSIIGGAGVRG